MKIQFCLNGETVACDTDGSVRLLDLLREDLHLTGTKEGCGEGECGACTVLLDGKAVNSCLIPAPSVDGKDVVTVEGLSRDGGLHPVQRAFMETGAVQCGFCTPGFIVATVALLNENSDPNDEEIRAGLEGNLCRCTGYAKIIEAVRKAAMWIQAESESTRSC
ncbi:(2Fe-2S)-binding protein [Candidatus Bipolaricaulota bacterium]|nr:(2Fe-2S)-binding protein [Candidatus Bipolaricaulota bacterium]